MNSVVIVGRLTKDVELKKTQSETAYVKFTVAVNRQYNKDNDHPEADWIDCVAWRHHAEFIAKYFSKGSKIGIVGKLQTSLYEGKNGQKIKATEVVVNEANFVESKGSGQQSNSPSNEENKSEPKEMEVIATPTDDDVPF